MHVVVVLVSSWDCPHTALLHSRLTLFTWWVNIDLHAPSSLQEESRSLAPRRESGALVSWCLESTRLVSSELCRQQLSFLITAVSDLSDGVTLSKTSHLNGFSQASQQGAGCCVCSRCCRVYRFRYPLLLCVSLHWQVGDGSSRCLNGLAGQERHLPLRSVICRVL